MTHKETDPPRAKSQWDELEADMNEAIEESLHSPEAEATFQRMRDKVDRILGPPKRKR